MLFAAGSDLVIVPVLWTQYSITFLFVQTLQLRSYVYPQDVEYFSFFMFDKEFLK